jgi:hypothetical protein
VLLAGGQPTVGSVEHQTSGVIVSVFAVTIFGGTSDHSSDAAVLVIRMNLNLNIDAELGDFGVG